MRFKIIVIAFLLIFSSAQNSFSKDESRFNFSAGIGFPYVGNVEFGVNLFKHISIEASLGYSLFAGTGSIYLDLENQFSNTSRLKIGVGPSTSFACGHGGCGESKGLDLRAKFLTPFWSDQNFGFYLGTGYFIGKGDNLYGWGSTTLLPHINAGLNWRL